jgi:hypothetical protein
LVHVAFFFLPSPLQNVTFTGAIAAMILQLANCKRMKRKFFYSALLPFPFPINSVEKGFAVDLQ